ncbi:MAG: DUF4270 domain-containing protein [Bacteroidota bacterium]
MVLIIALASCEEEFSNIDTNIIDQNFTTEFDDTRTVIAYSKRIPSVQSNGLPVYQFGVYNDPVYGKTSASLLSQVTLGPGDTDPNFGDCTVLDSVVLYLPFFNTSTVTGETTEFTLDSVFGSSPVNISIYESDFFLRDFDPETNFEEPQNYYSSQGPMFRDQIITGGVNNLMFTIENFTPSPEAHTIFVNQTNEQGQVEQVPQTVPPGIRVQLPKEFFQEKIIDQEGTLALLNNNNFREYFRGLYFEVTSTTDDGNLFLLNLNDGDSDALNDARINIYYTFKSLNGNETCEDEGLEEFPGDLEILFNTISVNTYENNIPLAINDALTNANTAEGEETLYVKGGAGAMTIIELFGEDADGNGIADELEDLRDREWLINEANLIFYVDQDRIQGGANEPERLFIFDAENNRRLIDFELDITSNNLPVDAITEHLGRLERGSDEFGDFYKIKITSHLSNLINRDSTNVALGLMVSQNVTEADFQNLETDLVPRPELIIDQVPASGVISPQGTVLFGNNTTNENKRLKLQIFYTEPE